MSSCNKGADVNGYTVVVDGPLLNLTPLGKQLMPPPMFEKQVTLLAQPVCVSMYNSHTAVLDVRNNLYYFNAEQIPKDLTPVMTVLQPFSSIQNFQYKETSYLVGICN